MEMSAPLVLASSADHNWLLSYYTHQHTKEDRFVVRHLTTKQVFHLPPADWHRELHPVHTRFFLHHIYLVAFTPTFVYFAAWQKWHEAPLLTLPVEDCRDFDMHGTTLVCSTKHCLYFFHGGEAPSQLPVDASRVVIVDGEAKHLLLSPERGSAFQHAAPTHTPNAIAMEANGEEDADSGTDKENHVLVLIQMENGNVVAQSCSMSIPLCYTTTIGRHMTVILLPSTLVSEQSSPRTQLGSVQWIQEQRSFVIGQYSIMGQREDVLFKFTALPTPLQQHDCLSPTAQRDICWITDVGSENHQLQWLTCCREADCRFFSFWLLKVPPSHVAGTAAIACCVAVMDESVALRAMIPFSYQKRNTCLVLENARALVQQSHSSVTQRRCRALGCAPSSAVRIQARPGSIALLQLIPMFIRNYDQVQQNLFAPVITLGDYMYYRTGAQSNTSRAMELFPCESDGED